MIKYEVLKEFTQGIRFTNGEGIDIDLISEIISDKATAAGLDISVGRDQIQSGSVFKKTYMDAITIYNNQHPSDYFHHCVMVTQTGTTVCLNFFYYGVSTLTAKKNKEEYNRQKGTIGGAILAGIGKVDQFAFDQEYSYYEIIKNIFDSIGD